MPYTPEPLPTYTFKNGAVATIHVIGQLTTTHIAAGVEKKMPAVPIPTFVADMGNGPVEQPNIASPDYLRAVDERKGRINMLVMDKLIDLAIDIEIDHNALKRIMADMARIGEPLDEISDKVAFVKHCCVRGVDELGALSALIQGNVEVAAEAAAATFSGDVPGQATIEMESAPIRGTVLVDAGTDSRGPLARHIGRSDGSDAA